MVHDPTMHDFMNMNRLMGLGPSLYRIEMFKITVKSGFKILKIQAGITLDNSKKKIKLKLKLKHQCTPRFAATSIERIKGALLGLRQMMKNAFCFTSKALFVLKIFRFLC